MSVAPVTISLSASVVPADFSALDVHETAGADNIQKEYVKLEATDWLHMTLYT